MIYSLLLSMCAALGAAEKLETPKYMELVNCTESESVARMSCSYKSRRFLPYRYCGVCPADTAHLYFDRKEVSHVPAWQHLSNDNCHVRCEFLKTDTVEAQCATDFCNRRHGDLPLVDCSYKNNRLSCKYEGMTKTKLRKCPDTMEEGVLLRDLYRLMDNYTTHECSYLR